MLKSSTCTKGWKSCRNHGRLLCSRAEGKYFKHGKMLGKGNSVIIKYQVLYLKDKHGRLATRVEINKNRMYKLELKIL